MSELLESYPLLLSITDVSAILGISANTARKLVKNDDLPAVRVGSRYKITKTKLLEYLGEKEDKGVTV